MLQRSDLADLVTGFTQLRKQGAEFTGRCPFHDERTPSFWVNPTKGVYHCFGCGASGDTISFVQEKVGLDFVESIEYLADRYRVELEYEGKDGPAQPRVNKRRLYELMDAATTFYEAYLWKAGAAEPVREYLVRRGITEETARAFRLGYSPESGKGLGGRAMEKGYTREELMEARLFTSRGTDFFRGRLMVPIIDRANRVLAFGARKLREEQFGGKYMNSAEGPLFHKGKTVYMAPGVLKAARDTDQVLLVEGYMDVIALWQAGFRNACAVMGANLGEEQIIELKRMAPRAVFAFDPDVAGQKATLGALELARRHELDVRVVLLPEGEDPADVLAGADGHDRMAEMLDHGVSLMHYRVSALLGSGNLQDEGDRERIWREGVKFFRSVPDSPERRRQVDRFGFGLGLDAEGVAALQKQAGSDAPLAELARGRGRANAAGPAARGPGSGQGGTARGRSPHDSAALMAERRLLASAMALVDKGEKPLADTRVEAEMFQLEVHRRAWEALSSGRDKPLDVSRIRSDSELVGLIAELGALAQRDFADRADDLHQLLSEYELRLEQRWIDRSIAALKERLRAADEEDPELDAQLRALLVRQRALNPRLRDTPRQE